MDSNINEKVFGIYWDLNTCHSNYIGLIARKVREIYVKTNTEKEFLCSTVEDIPNRNELKDNLNVQIDYIPNELINLNNLKTKIDKHVTECIHSYMRPVVIVITSDDRLTRFCLSHQILTEVIFIYGQDLKHNLIQLRENSLPFIELESMAIKMTEFGDISLSSEIKLGLNFNQSDVNCNKAKSMRIFH